MTQEKTCFKCGSVKPIREFYKHSKMADGRVNKCKECSKRDVRENRSKKILYYREYDRRRGNRQTAAYVYAYRAAHPKKYAAHIAARNAVRAGILVPLCCESCGADESIHAHHDDYEKQLNVRWLCAACHKAWHKEHGEGANG